MDYVYFLRSERDEARTYIGSTADLKTRLKRHKEGGAKHTSHYRPWKLVTYLAFSTKDQAIQFEFYLKTGSGRASASRRLWESAD
ncbi:excinuclease ABC subunit C [Haloferula helveola]|uniref:Excinuclease ABC subunit C n=1 Tax=Haloferula helveola TaxID=490095 RepID=A0ABM7RJ75_9BACT|nr:excinuclease ABC subunit C [Haloferula helveola]